ncbi:MAG: fatty acyl-CoA reductase [Myxococcota bacterium]
MSSVLLTGATGFIGKVVLSELLHRRDTDRVWLLIRPRRGQSARERWARIRSSPALREVRNEAESKVKVLEGDIEQKGCGLSREAEHRFRHHSSATGAPEITRVIHCAASVDFDLPLSQAFAINTRGSENVFELARSLPKLKRFTYVSTAYVHRYRSGPLAERPVELPWSAAELGERLAAGASSKRLLRESGYPNTYTLTKALAESLLLSASERGPNIVCPLTIVRPSIVSACIERPFPGWLEGSAGLNGVVRLYGSGVLRTMVFDPSARLDVIPGDAVAQHIVRATFERRFPTITHAVAGVRQALPLGEVAKQVIEFFEGRTVIRRPFAISTERRMGLRYWTISALFQILPWAALAVASKLRGHHRDSHRLWALVKTLATIGSTFGHFSRRTFDFEQSHSSIRLDAERYPRLICEAVATHLIRPIDSDDRTTSDQTRLASL